MANHTDLGVSVKGTEHIVSISKKWSTFTVSVDGVEYQTYKTGKNSLLVINEDFPLEIDGEAFIIALRGNKKRLVNNNQYIDNGEEFIAAKPLPKWAWIFVILNFALVALGGAIPAGFGVGGAAGCAGVINSGRSTANKVALCCLITVGCWLGALFLATLFISLFA